MILDFDGIELFCATVAYLNEFVNDFAGYCLGFGKTLAPCILFKRNR